MCIGTNYIHVMGLILHSVGQKHQHKNVYKCNKNYNGLSVMNLDALTLSLLLD